MNAETESGESRDYSEASDAERVRELILRLGLSQRAAARELEIGERDMRAYCAGQPVPRVVLLALERLVDMQSQVADPPDILGT